jgi:cell division protein FtsW
MKPRFRIILPTVLIFVMGLVMIFNTSAAEVIDHAASKNIHTALLRQIAYGALGIILGYITYSIGYKKLVSIAPKLLAVCTALLAAVFIPGIGIVANGARRWISCGGISLQPSEFTKLAILLYFIYRYCKLEGKVVALADFVKILLVIGVPMLLILVEPNNGTVGVIAVALMALFFMFRVPLSFWAAPMLGMALLVTAFAIHMPYVRARIEVYLHPELDLQGKGLQPYQAKIAAGSGGFWGKGPGSSMQKLSYLPEAQNDYIAAIYAEEYGFLGMLFLLSMYSWFALEGLRLALTSKNPQGMYVAASATFLFSFQAFLNLGVVSGLLPSTGLNLPFFSQGGSSLLANCASLGILMSVWEAKQNA